MAQAIFDYYTKAGELGGEKARTKLSIITKLTSLQATSVPDSDEYKLLFETALAEIKKEFGDSSSKNNPPVAPTVNDDGQIPVLRKQLLVISDYLAQRELFEHNLDLTLRRITEAMAVGLSVVRAGVWLFDPEKKGITCQMLFDVNEMEFRKGTFLAKENYPMYFSSLAFERTIAAHQAQTDIRTREFALTYLSPLGITSMLDVPIWRKGEMVGVICFEHIGPERTWTKDEENFAYMVSNLAAMALEKNYLARF